MSKKRQTKGDKSCKVCGGKKIFSLLNFFFFFRKGGKGGKRERFVVPLTEASLVDFFMCLTGSNLLPWCMRTTP